MAQPYPEFLRETNPADGRLLIAIVVSSIEHEVARDAQARADGRRNDGQEGEQQHAGENKMWHRAPAGGCVAVNCVILRPASSSPYTY